MKKIAFSGLLVLFCVQIVLAQEKVEAPNWNVGDKWTSTDGMTIEVIGKDENSYKVKFQKETFLFEKSTLNRIYPVEGKKRQTNRVALRRFLDFPLVVGKQWKDNYSAQVKWEEEHNNARNVGSSIGDETQIFESYRVLGWEDVGVEAGHFKAIKIEYKREWSSPTGDMRAGKAWYWYSPEVKNVVRMQYDKSPMWSQYHDVELKSYNLLK